MMMRVVAGLLLLKIALAAVVVYLLLGLLRDQGIAARPYVLPLPLPQVEPYAPR